MDKKFGKKVTPSSGQTQGAAEQTRGSAGQIRRSAPTGTIVFCGVILIIIAGCFIFLGWQNYRLKNDVRDLQITVEKVREQKPVNWILPEINYLIQIADINLRINKDIPGALNVLKTADKKLSKVDNSKFAQVRQSLTNDISTLQAAQRVNIADTVTQIVALAQRIENIPIIPSAPYKEPRQAVTEPKVKSSQSLWQRFLTITGTKLKNIIVVRRLEQPMEPLPTLEEQVYLRQNIAFMLEQAEWAVLHRERQVYNNSLKRAAKMANRCFAHNLAALNNIMHGVQKLQKIDIDPPMPDISQSIQAINELLDKDRT